MLFDWKKYQWLIIALILLILGFVLMSGPKPDSPDQFDESIFSFRRITLAPISVLLSYVGIIFIILKQPKKDVRTDKKRS